jgi:hypothetical protein
MRKLLGCGFIGVFLVLGALFAYQWSRTTPGADTGPTESANGAPARRASSAQNEGKDDLADIARNPARYAGKTVTIRGRVRGPLRLAAHRTLYRLMDASGHNSLLVVDDREPPKEYWARSVTGRVQLLKAPPGQASYPYVVSLKDGVKFDLKWQDAKRFFADAVQDIEHGAREARKIVGR